MMYLDNIQSSMISNVIKPNTLIFITMRTSPSSLTVSHTWFREELVLKPHDCIYWLHTHDNSGIIHVESPQNNTFNLGQFFDIWGQKFNNTQLFGFSVENSTNGTLTVYLNGTAINQSSFREIPIFNHEDIVVVYGAPPPEIQPYEFPY